jgi:hypothetical protein
VGAVTWLYRLSRVAMFAGSAVLAGYLAFRIVQP